MARFTLVVRPDGQALLTTPEPLSAEVLEPVRAVLDRWSAGEFRIGLLADTDVVQVTELEIDLERGEVVG